MVDTSDDLYPEVFFWIFKKLLDESMTKAYEKELGTEFVKEFGEKLVEYGKNSYGEYQKELQKVHNKLHGAYGETLDELLNILLKKIDNAIPCKEETCLNPYEWSSVYQYIYKNHFKTNIIRIFNKHLEGLDPTQPNYNREIKNIRDVLIYLSRPMVYKTLFAVYMLTEYDTLSDILSTHENSSINDKMIEQIKRLKASNDVRNYIRVIQDYIQKQIEWVDLAYQKASEYIEDTTEELFHNNTEGFVEKMDGPLLRYIILKKILLEWNRNSS
jgi:hypothetical protein